MVQRSDTGVEARDLRTYRYAYHELAPREVRQQLVSGQKWSPSDKLAAVGAVAHHAATVRATVTSAMRRLSGFT